VWRHIVEAMGPRRLRYGTRRGQRADLWLPAERNPDGSLPVVVLIHGGFWRSPYTKLLMTRLARSVRSQGWAAWNVEYRRVGWLGGGGGWPATLIDVALAVDHLGALAGVDVGRVVVCGHSAGGQLALWVAGRRRLPAGAPGAGPLVLVRGAVALAGVTDLRRIAERGAGNGATAVSRLLGGPPEQVGDRYAVASPIELLPLGVPSVLIHGLDDQTVSPSASERFASRAVDAGDEAVYVAIAGAGHRSMLDPRGPGWAAALVHLRRLLT
jgi:acetyl esterase/lipase